MKTTRISQLLKISDSFNNDPHQHTKLAETSKVWRLGNKRIKDSAKKFTKRRVSDTTDVSLWVDYVPHVGEAMVLDGFSEILAVPMGGYVYLLPTMFPTEQMTIFNASDQEQKYKIMCMFKANGLLINSMDGVACGTIVTG